MRSHSFQSLLFSGLVSASAAAAGADVLTSRPTPKLVTVWVESTVTTCPLPTPPPPPCSAVPPTSTLTLSSIVTITSGAPGGGHPHPSWSGSWPPHSPSGGHGSVPWSSVSSASSSSSSSSATSSVWTWPTSGHSGSSTAETSPSSTETWPTSSGSPTLPTWPTSSGSSTWPTSSHGGELPTWPTHGSSTSTVETSVSSTKTWPSGSWSSSATSGTSTSESWPSTSTSTASATPSSPSSTQSSTGWSTTTPSTTTTSTWTSTTSSTTSTSTTSTSTWTSTSHSSTWTSTSTSTTSTSTTSTSTTSTSTSHSTTSTWTSTTATSTSHSTTQSSTWSTTSHSTTSTTSTSTTHTSTSTTATPPSCTDYWLGTIKHQGLAPYSGNSTYQVFRNVKDYGAKGDGSTDDTDAINKAISDGNRCAPTRGACTGSTVTPALVYFPPGTYVVSKPIIMYYYTSLIGNPSCLPTIKATAGFFGRWVLDSNQYQTDGKLGWGATNVFFRQVANFIFDLTQPTNGGFEALSAIHWPSSQATSLSNIVIHLNKDKTVPQQGIFIEEGSGGFVGDIVIDGGWHALEVGNQQFTFRNISISNSGTAVKQSWSWGWTYQEIKINKCDIGFDIANDAGSVGSITVLDSEIANTPVGINFGVGSSAPPVSNNIIIENLKLNNVPTAVQGPSGTVLSGSAGAVTIPAWGRGNSYTANSGPSAFQGSFTRHSRPSDLLAGSVYYTRSKPQYESEPLSNILSARTAGAKGDGVTDDTLVLNTLFALAASTGKVVFLDAGYYLVTSTIKIPAGSRVTGEGYPIILSSGAFFNDATKPQPVVQIGKQGDQGSIEWSNAIVSTKGAQAGAILIEYNLKSPKSAPSGLWDVHVRIGGFAGSDLQFAQCQKTPGTTITSANLQKECISGFLSVHVTKQSSGLLMENCWIWVADHDLEIGANNQQITIYAGRGLLIESTAGDIWLYGTAVEHHQLYEYQLVGTQDIVMGQIQTETAYYQRNPDATIPFAAVPQYSDPVFSAGDSGWGLRVVDSKDIIVYGAGLYSFFNNYSTSCSDQGNGSTCQKRIFSVEGDSKISVYNLNTVGTTRMFTVDGVDKASYADNNDGFVQTIAKVQIPS